MAERVCPWWLGYVLVSPLRRWYTEDPAALLRPYLQAGATVLEPGPGMGFFTLPMARLVGAEGRVIAVDIQVKMLDALRRRAQRAGLAARIEARLATPASLSVEDLRGRAHFVLAFAVVHEMPSVESFFQQAAAAMKPGALLFLAEPRGHVDAAAWQRELDAAQTAGLAVAGEPTVRRSLAALLRKA